MYLIRVYFKYKGFFAWRDLICYRKNALGIFFGIPINKILIENVFVININKTLDLFWHSIKKMQTECFWDSYKKK